MQTKTITLGISGASGVIYGMRLLECLLQAKQNVQLLMSNAAREVFRIEEDITLPKSNQELIEFLHDKYDFSAEQLKVFADHEWTASVASGSGVADAMVICPCSSSTVSSIAHGASNNLLERAADVVLKERKQLILVHRETPLSIIHLENLLKVSKAGATVLPASPGFYNKPKEISDLVDFIIARILDHLGIPQELCPKWGI